MDKKINLEDIKNRNWGDYKNEQNVIDALVIELERAEFLLKQEMDAYGSDVLDILDAVSEGRMTKMKAHQRLNKCYKVRFKDLLQ